MEIEKLSLKSIKNVLSRAELKKIMAGSGSSGNCSTSSCGVGDEPGGPVCCLGYDCVTVGPFGTGGECI